MKVVDEGFGGAIALLRDDQDASIEYYELLDVLGGCDPELHGRRKAKTAYVYDQTGLVKRVRAELEARGWRHGQPLWPMDAYADDGLVVRGDMIKPDLHAIFEFGNRASYAYNLLTRVMVGVQGHGIRLSVFVTPTLEFASRIDSNLACFERSTAELARLQALMPSAVPGAVMVVGVEPRHL